MLVVVVQRFPIGRVRRVFVSWLASLVSLGVAEFTYMYWNLSAHSSAAFSEGLSRLDAAYIALGNFTTAGSGIDAMSAQARGLVMAQHILGFATVVIGLALVVSKRSEKNGPAADR